MDDINIILKSTGDSDVLIDGVSGTVKHKTTRRWIFRYITRIFR